MIKPRPPGGVSWRNFRAPPLTVDSGGLKYSNYNGLLRRIIALTEKMRILKFRKETPPERADTI